MLLLRMCLRVAWTQSVPAAWELWQQGSSAARRGETTSMSSSDLLSHQNHYACGLVRPHSHDHPRIRFLMFSHARCFQISLSAVKSVLYCPYCAVKTKFLQCWGNKWGGLALDYLNNKVSDTIHPVFGRTSALISRCITRLWLTAEQLALILWRQGAWHHILLFLWLNTHPDVCGRLVPDLYPPSPTIVLPPLLQERVEEPFGFGFLISLNLSGRNFNL